MNRRDLVAGLMATAALPALPAIGMPETARAIEYPFMVAPENVGKSYISMTVSASRFMDEMHMDFAKAYTPSRSIWWMDSGMMRMMKDGVITTWRKVQRDGYEAAWRQTESVQTDDVPELRDQILELAAKEWRAQQGCTVVAPPGDFHPRSAVALYKEA